MAHKVGWCFHDTRFVARVCKAMMMIQLGAHIILKYFASILQQDAILENTLLVLLPFLRLGFFRHNKHHKNVAMLQCFEIKLVFRLLGVHYFGCSHVKHVTKTLCLMESFVWVGETGSAHGWPYQDWRHISYGWQHMRTKSTTHQSEFRYDKKENLLDKGLSQIK